MTNLLLAIVLVMVVHVSAMASVAHLFKIKIREISFGVGKKIASIGVFSIRLFIFSGFVRMVDSRDEGISPEMRKLAFNHQPLTTQLFVIISGVAACAFLAEAINDPLARQEFWSAFEEIIWGALSPLDKAQEYLVNIENFVATESFQNIFVVVLIKQVAINMLPLPLLNGGQFLITLAKWGKSEVAWEEKVVRWLSIPLVYIFGAWFVALVVYLSGSFN